jgi:hypothetical protein
LLCQPPAFKSASYDKKRSEQSQNMFGLFGYLVCLVKSVNIVISLGSVRALKNFFWLQYRHAGLDPVSSIINHFLDSGFHRNDE